MKRSSLLITCFLLILGLIAAPGIAAPPANTNTDMLTLQDCIGIALKNKADIGIARNQLQIAEATQKSAFGNFLPNLSFSMQGSHNEQGQGKRYFSGFEYTSPASNRNYYSSGISLYQPLFTGGKIRYSKEVADLGYDKAELGVETSRQNVALDVTAAYLDVLKTQELVKVYEKTLESSQGQVGLVKERYNLGAVAQSDVYKAQTRAGNDEIRLLQQKNTLEMQKRNLNLAMGREPAEIVNLQPLDSDTLAVPDMDLAKREARQANRALRSYKFDLQSAEVNILIARANLLPSLNASLSYDRSGFRLKELYSGFDKNWDFTMGVRLEIPLFSQFNNTTGIQSRKADLSIAKKRYADAKLQIDMQVENLIQQLKTYKKIIHLNELNMKSAHEDLRMARERYNVGQATLLDVLDAQAALTNAQQILVYAKFDARNLEAQLQAVLGRLMDSTS